MEKLVKHEILQNKEDDKVGKVVIIGGGAGGASTATRLRRLSEEIDIKIFEKDSYVSYANCGLPYYIGGVIPDRRSLLLQTPHSFKERYNVDVCVYSEVKEINPTEKYVVVYDKVNDIKYREYYDKLVVSPGAKPIVPPIEGINSEKVFTLRNIHDVDSIKSFIDQQNPQNAIIIGGGLIGLEMAENLHNIGIHVSIIEKRNQLLPFLDWTFANSVRRKLESKHIDVLLNTEIKEFFSENGILNVRFQSGEVWQCDMCILSIGVVPDIQMLIDAGLKTGVLGGIITNKFLQTSNPDIYALGDAIEVQQSTLEMNVLSPLASPANKQARFVADNIVINNWRSYKGTIGTAIFKVFDLHVGVTGLTFHQLEKANINYDVLYSHTLSHAGYYPGGKELSIKLLFSPMNDKVLGAQIIGGDGVDKRIDLIGQVIKSGGTIYDLQELDHAYAPPFSSAKDPVNMVGYIAENIIQGRVKIQQWDKLKEWDNEDCLILDVRTHGEFVAGYIPNAINIPLDSIRESLESLDPNKRILVYCGVGMRAYLACRILMQNGFKHVYNLSGGYKTYLQSIADY